MPPATPPSHCARRSKRRCIARLRWKPSRIIGAVTRDSVRGSYIETHYSWLLRTFLWGLLWLVLVTFVFVVSVIGIFLLWLPWGILTIWYLYRVIRGWLRLNDGRPAPE